MTPNTQICLSLRQYSTNKEASGKFAVADIDERLVYKIYTDSDIAKWKSRRHLVKNLLETILTCELLLSAGQNAGWLTMA